MTGVRVAVARTGRRLEWGAASRLAKLVAGTRRTPPPGSPAMILNSARSILVIRLDGAGDVVLTSAFLRELRRNAPSAVITLVVAPAVLNLVELCPYVDRLLTFDPARRRFRPNTAVLGRAWTFAKQQLRNEPIDLAIVPRWDTDSYAGAFVACLSGAASRVTYSENVSAEKSRENHGLDDLFTTVFTERREAHEATTCLRLIELLGGTVQDTRLESWVDAQDEARASEILSDASTGGSSSLVGLGVGAGDPKRKWPIERFGQVASKLINLGHRVVVLGGEPDRADGDQIASGTGGVAISAAGRTTLRQTVATLRHCNLFIGNDAGPMHMASAAGVPVVEISCHPAGGDPMHANSPVRFGPWQVRSAVLQPLAAGSCGPFCESNRAHCINNVAAADVLKTALKLLNASE